MPISENQNQWEKLFEHLSYCLSVLKKSFDQQKLQIFKRVQHDVQILQRYIKSLMKYNDKRQKEIERLVNELKQKEFQLEFQNSRILELSGRISKKQEQIKTKEGIIEHLKYSQKIDASYVSSILVCGTESLLQRKLSLLNRKTTAQDDSADDMSLSEYSENMDCQKVTDQGLETTCGQGSTRSEIRSKTSRKSRLFCNIINEEQQSFEEKSPRSPGGYPLIDLHKVSSLVLAE